MASKTFYRSGPISLDINPSPETTYHFPASPNEPGKFDFYRVHLANHAYHSDPTISDTTLDAPILTAPHVNSSIAKRRWTPFADLLSSDQTKSSTVTSASSSNSFFSSKSETNSSNESSVSSNTNGLSSLTDAVKNAMKKGQITVPENPTRRPISGTTLSSKDLNHLSPQSM